MRRHVGRKTSGDDRVRTNLVAMHRSLRRSSGLHPYRASSQNEQPNEMGSALRSRSKRLQHSKKINCTTGEWSRAKPTKERHANIIDVPNNYSVELQRKHCHLGSLYLSMSFAAGAESASQFVLNLPSINEEQTPLPFSQAIISQRKHFASALAHDSPRLDKIFPAGGTLHAAQVSLTNTERFQTGSTIPLSR